MKPALFSIASAILKLLFGALVPVTAPIRTKLFYFRYGYG